MHSRALETIARAKEAKRLYPRWQKLVERQAEFQRTITKLDRKLTRVSGKLVKLRNAISVLVKR